MPEIKPDVPAREWLLSPNGRERSVFLAERLRKYDTQAAIVSSAEPKARETAEIVAGELGRSVEVLAGLHEHDRSQVPFLSSDKFAQAVFEFFTHPSELVFGSETADQAYERFYETLRPMLAESISSNLVVVAHGTVITLFVSRLAGVEPYPLWKRLGLPSFVVLSLPDLDLLVVVDKIA